MFIFAVKVQGNKLETFRLSLLAFFFSLAASSVFRQAQNPCRAALQQFAGDSGGWKALQAKHH